MIRKITLIVVIFCVLISINSNKVYSQAGLANFYTQNGKLYDPNGNVFIMKGINVPGAKWDVNHLTVGDIDLIVNCWKFNTIRVNNFLYYQSEWDQFDTNNDLDAIINTFTSRKIVVILEAHDKTGSYYKGSSLTKLTNWFKGFAEKYKDNPYLFFNIMNEPGDSYLPEKDLWLNVHRTVITAIRDDIGADNIIVVDGAASGQDVGDVRLAKVPEKTSAILSFGKDVVDFNGKHYDNILFSVHIWDMWNVPESRFIDFFDRVAAKGLPIIVGEWGAFIDEGVSTKKAAQNMMNVVKSKQIGRIVWAWNDTTDKLTTKNDGGGFRINSCTVPTNLTWLGNLVWQDNHN